MINMFKKVFNWSEVHLSEMTCYKIHTLVILYCTSHCCSGIPKLIEDSKYYYLYWTVSTCCLIFWFVELVYRLFEQSNIHHTLHFCQNQLRRNQMYHGLRTPNEAFFHRNPKLLGLGKQFGQINFGAFGVFSANLSAPILVQWVPCPCFPSINHYFYKKLSLYIQISNVYFGLGFEFGPQRIRDWAITCPYQS